MKMHRFADGKIEVVLSRRNIEVMLAKLNGHPPDSLLTALGGGEAEGLILRVEENDIHYGDRPYGRAHPDTEAAVAALHP